MPAVLIRQFDALAPITRSTRRPERLPVLSAQAGMIHRPAKETVPEPADLADIESAYQGLSSLHRRGARAV